MKTSDKMTGRRGAGATAARCFGAGRRHCLPAVAMLLAVAAAAATAGPVYWDMPAGKPFTECRLQGATVDRDGFLGPGLPYGEALPLASEVVWKVIDDGRGGYFAGTGHEGLILHIDHEGRSEQVADLDDAEIFSLILLPDGVLVAGCGPGGQVYLIAPEQEPRLVGAVPGGYVWAMAADPGADRVWLAAGSPAALYLLDPVAGTLTEIVGFPAENALDVMIDRGGRLLVSTQGPGLVYLVDPDQPAELRILLETDQNEARQFIAGPDGQTYLLALASAEENTSLTDQDAPDRSGPQLPRVMPPMAQARNPEEPERAALYRVPVQGAASRIWTGDLDLMIAAWDPDLGWIAGGPLQQGSGLAVLFRLDPPAGHSPLTSWEGGDVLDLLVGAQDGRPRVVVAEAHPGRLDLLGGGSRQRGRAIGPVLDAGRPVSWGRLSWAGIPGGGAPRWSVRTGDIAVPDWTWTDWTGTWTGQDQQLDLAASRYLQWRVEFPAADGSPDPTLRVTSVSVSAWAENRPPVIADFKREEIRSAFLGGMMNHRDSVTRTFASGLKAEFNRGDPEPRQAPGGRDDLGAAVLVFSWEASDPDHDRLDHTLQYRPEGRRAWRTVATGSGQGLEGWDTAELPDGRYEVRLQVTDRPDNPADEALTAERLYGPVRVDNTPPRITGLTVEAGPQGLELEFSAEDEGSALAGAFLVLPDRTRERLDPRDRICDSRTERFEVVRPWPAAEGGDRPAWVRIEVLDLSGNLAEAESEVR